MKEESKKQLKEISEKSKKDSEMNKKIHEKIKGFDKDVKK